MLIAVLVPLAYIQGPALHDAAIGACHSSSTIPVDRIRRATVATVSAQSENHSVRSVVRACFATALLVCVCSSLHPCYEFGLGHLHLTLWFVRAIR